MLKPWEGGSSSIDILGIHIDLDIHTATPTEQHRAELQSSLANIMSRSSEIRARDYLRWFGQAQWLIYSVARTPLCLFPHVMRLLRKIGSSGQWDAKFQIDDRLKREAHRLSQLVANSIRTFEQEKSGPDVWSDASTTSLGAFHSASHLGIICPISCESTQIFIAEFLAGLLGFRFCDDAATWVCDNMAAAYAMCRGHSGSELGDFLLRLWITHVATPSAVRWVDTHCNYADQLTRVITAPEPCERAHITMPVRWKLGGKGASSSVCNPREKRDKKGFNKF